MTKKQNPDAIYREFENATRDLTAWAVMKGADCVAKIVVKYGGRTSPHGLTVRAYVHVLGVPMVRGIARGGGYDMRTASVAQACKVIAPRDGKAVDAMTAATMQDFGKLVDQGYDIPHQLRELGYDVVAVL